MKKFLLGSIAGIGVTLLVQHIYNKRGKFYLLVNAVKSDLSKDSDSSNNALNVFDKLSLIYQRFRR